jgi:hypothetical protein
VKANEKLKLKRKSCRAMQLNEQAREFNFRNFNIQVHDSSMVLLLQTHKITQPTT